MVRIFTKNIVGVTPNTISYNKSGYATTIKNISCIQLITIMGIKYNSIKRRNPSKTTIWYIFHRVSYYKITEVCWVQP